MNNEPVAWINKEDGNLFVDWDKNPYAQEHFPLYTHPHHASDVKQIKELSVEEIEKIWHEHEKWLATVPLSFARAILKKAREHE